MQHYHLTPHFKFLSLLIRISKICEIYLVPLKNLRNCLCIFSLYEIKYIFNFCSTSFILDYFNLSIDTNIMIFSSKLGVFPFNIDLIEDQINPSWPVGGGAFPSNIQSQSFEQHSEINRVLNEPL